MTESLGWLVARVRMARALLPALILVVVVAFELFGHPFQSQRWFFWVQLGFYGLVGPLVTWITLSWIVEELRQRGQAEDALIEANRRLEVVRKVFQHALLAETLDEVMGDMASAIGKAVRAEAALSLEGFRAATPGFPGGDNPGIATYPLQRSRGRLYIYGTGIDETFLEVLAAEADSVLEAAKARTRELLTLFEVDQALKAEENLEKLLGGLLEKIMDWASASAGAVYMLDEGGALHLWAQRGELDLAHIFLPEGVWRAALAEPTFVERHLLAVPLHKQHITGVLVLDANHEHLVEKLPFLSFLAGQVVLAVRNAQAYLRAEELAINEERSRIAREIHDGIAQTLAFMALKLDLATRLISTDGQAALNEVQTVKSTLRAQIQEIRRSIFALRPIDLERYGFLESVKRYARAFGEQDSVRVRLDLPDRVDISQASELVLFRVLQESLNNVAKHAQASLVWVSLHPVNEHGAKLVVKDDGKGFQVNAERTADMGSFGLVQMRERVVARGGWFSVVSSPDQGVVVTAELAY